MNKLVYDFDFDIQDEIWCCLELENIYIKGIVKLKHNEFWSDFKEWEKTKNAIKQVLNEKYGYIIPYKKVLNDDEVMKSIIELKIESECEE